MNSPQDSSPKLLDRFLAAIEGAPGSDRLLLRITFFMIIASFVWLAFSLNQEHSEVTPTRGGTITEGIIGTPRFVNPALALTRADQDVTSLIYSGLMKINPAGELVNDIAESIVVSDDGLTYNVILRRDVTFHDDTPVTARDVIYTIRLIQDPGLKSPLRGNWTDVLIEEIDEYELNIVLEEAYAPFIENFTVGIMPAHAWSSLPTEQLPFSQLNTEPIGSGPFMITDVAHDTSGLINHYTLTARNNGVAEPKIDSLELIFYPNEDQLITAMSGGLIDSTAYIPPERIKEVINNNFRLIEEPLPRTFGIFFNQNRSAALRDAVVREALTLALDRDVLIEKALYGYGVPITAPTTFPASELQSENGITGTATTSRTDQVIALLEDDGWSQNNNGLWEKQTTDGTIPLSVTIRTSNTPLFEALIESIAEQWEAIGVEVVTEQFEQSGLVQSVIRPREFEALLFGLDMSRSYDLYPFWHSSQQDDPGLNIAQYANVEVDALLDSAQSEQFGPTRIETLIKASEIIAAEYPAVFLFQPTFTYVISNDMTITDINEIGRPADRFNNVTEWHTENDSLWPIFRQDI